MNFRNDLRGEIGKAKNVVNDAKVGVKNLKNQLIEAQKTQLHNYFIEKPGTVDGCEFIENSLAWKLKCMHLPCSSQDWWAGYVTTVIKNVNIVVPGQLQKVPVIIQLWKGWCERLGGRFANDFPGGIGAEVGIYYTVPQADASNGFRGSPYWIYGPTSFANLAASSARNDVKQQVQKRPALEQVASRLPRQQSPTDPSGEVWYPIPRQWWPNLWFKLVHPGTGGEEFFHTSTQTTYWLTRWMDPTDYVTKYQTHHRTPLFPANYRLYFTVNGQTFPAW